MESAPGWVRAKWPPWLKAAPARSLVVVEFLVELSLTQHRVGGINAQQWPFLYLCVCGALVR